MIVDVRNLHKALQVKSQCSNWMRWKIEKYNLIENEDYVFCPEKTKGRPRSQWKLSVDTAIKIVKGNKNCEKRS